MNLEEITRLIRSLEGRVDAIEKRFGSEGAADALKTKKTLSAKEFLMTKNIKTETQKVLALAYFLEHQNGLASYNVPDLQSAFRAARETLPKNMNDAVNKNIARGFLMEAKDKKDFKKAWQLTSTGEKFVDSRM